MNTLEMADKLQAAGVPEKQARAHIEVLHNAAHESASITDMRGMMAELRKEMAQLRAELKADMAAQTASLAKLIITGMVALSAILAVVVKVL